MGFRYLLEKASRQGKILLKERKKYLELSATFPEDSELTSEQRALKVNYLKLLSEFAKSWYQAEKYCASKNLSVQLSDYIRVAGLGYFPAPERVELGEIAIKEESQLPQYPIDKLRAAAEQLDPAGCYWWAVYLHKVAASEKQEQAIRVENDNGDTAKHLINEATSLRQQASHYYYYAAIQQHPKALVDMAWIFIHEFGRNQSEENSETNYFELGNNFLAQAIEQEFAEAYYKKGLQYQHGWGEQKNSELALKYFREAAKRDFGEAITAINEYYKANFENDLTLINFYLNEPDRLARIILDSYLGVQQANHLLHKLKENLSNKNSLLVFKLFSLIGVDEASDTILELVQELSLYQQAESNRQEEQSSLAPVFTAVESAYPVVLELLLLFENVRIGLLDVALSAFNKDDGKDPSRKRKRKECIQVIIKESKSVDLALLWRLNVYDLEILTWMLEHKSLNIPRIIHIQSDWEALFIIKLLSAFPDSHFSNLYRFTRLFYEVDCFLFKVTLQNFLSNPTTEADKAAIYEAQLGHNALGYLLRLLTIFAVKYNDSKLKSLLEKRNIKFAAPNFFVYELSSRLILEALYECQTNEEMFKMLMAIPKMPFLFNLHNSSSYGFDKPLIHNKNLIFKLVTPTDSNLSELENSLGTQENGVVRLNNGFLMMVLDYIVSEAFDDDEAFKLIIALMKTDSEIIQAAIKRGDQLCYLVLRQILEEMLCSAENSAFWDVLNFELKRSQTTNNDGRTQLSNTNLFLHNTRRQSDPQFGNFRSLLESDLSIYRDKPSCLLQLIQHGDNKDRLSHGEDYRYLLEKNKMFPNIIVFLLYICQKLKITVPNDLLKELAKKRHEIIDYLKELRKVNPLVTQTLLLDITNHEAKDIEHNKKGRTLLSTLFRLPRGFFNPDPSDKDDAIAKAYVLLIEVNRELENAQIKSEEVVMPASGEKISIATDHKLEIKNEKTENNTSESADKSEKATLSQAKSTSENDDFLATVFLNVAETFIDGIAKKFASSNEKGKEKEKSWHKQKSLGSNAEAIKRNSAVFAKLSSLENADNDPFTSAKATSSIPSLRPDPRDADALL